MSDSDQPYRDAALIRELEDLGAVHLDRPRYIGFERRPTKSRTYPRPVSPGAGVSPDEQWWGAPESRRRR